jgi:hypothetical protein
MNQHLLHETSLFEEKSLDLQHAPADPVKRQLAVMISCRFLCQPQG